MWSSFGSTQWVEFRAKACSLGVDALENLPVKLGQGGLCRWAVLSRLATLRGDDGADRDFCGSSLKSGKDVGEVEASWDLSPLAFSPQPVGVSI